MSEEAGFFTGVAGDRKYTARFLNLKLHEAMQRTEGVIKHMDGELETSHATGLNLAIAAGVAIKGGIIYRNLEPLTLVLSSIAEGQKRYDRIAVHIDRYRRTMQAKVLQGDESTDPVVPEYSSQDDIPLAKVLIDRSAGPTVVTVTDERVMRPAFLTDANSIDDLSEGETYGRITKDKAIAINAGQTGGSIRAFLPQGRKWSLIDVVQTAYLHTNSTLVAGIRTTGRLAYSTDYGLTWTEDVTIDVDNAIYAIVHNGQYYIAVGGAGASVFRTTNPVNGWTKVHFDENIEYLDALCMLSPSNLIASCRNSEKILSSLDSGLTWSITGTHTDGGLSRLEHLGGTVVLGGAYNTGKIYKSVNSGTTWTLVKNTGISNYQFGFLRHVGSGVVLAGLEQNGKLFRSTDYGDTWDSGITLDGLSGYSSLFIDGDRLLLGAGNWIYESQDSGLTWPRKWFHPGYGKVRFIGKNSAGMYVTITDGSVVCWGLDFQS